MNLNSTSDVEIISLFNNLPLIDKLFYSIYFFILPSLALLSHSGIPNLSEILILLLSWTACVGSYVYLRSGGYPTPLSLIVGLVSIIVISGIGLMVIYDVSNPYETYLPYYSAIGAWGFPTIMWYEGQWFIKRKSSEDGVNFRENTNRLQIFSESVGLTLALYYTHMLVTLNISASTQNAGSRIFMGMLISYLIFILVRYS